MTPSFISEFQVFVYGQEENILMLLDRSYPGKSNGISAVEYAIKLLRHREDIPNQIPLDADDLCHVSDFRLCFLEEALLSLL